MSRGASQKQAAAVKRLGSADHPVCCCHNRSRSRSRSSLSSSSLAPHPLLSSQLCSHIDRLFCFALSDLQRHTECTSTRTPRQRHSPCKMWAGVSVSYLSVIYSTNLSLFDFFFLLFLPVSCNFVFQGRRASFRRDSNKDRFFLGLRRSCRVINIASRSRKQGCQNNEFICVYVSTVSENESQEERIAAL